MELFIPTLIVVVITALFAFLIIPRMGPMTLAIISLLALIAAGIHHYSLFSTEYRLSTWQYAAAAYAPFVVFGLAILFIIASAYYLIKTPFMTMVKTPAIPNTLNPEDTLGAINAGATSLMNTVTTPFAQVGETISNAVKNMPSASTATNPLTAAINTGIKNISAFTSQATNFTKPVNNMKKSPIIPGLGMRASEI